MRGNEKLRAIARAFFFIAYAKIFAQKVYEIVCGLKLY
jgi:hypothetical protein